MIDKAGRNLSDEARFKMGATNRGKPFSDERKSKMSADRIGKNMWSKGRKLSDETKRKMSETRKGRKGHPCSDETKEKLRNKLIGRKLPDEIKKKISIGHVGLKKSPETCAKISLIHTGMQYSDETKNKLKEIWLKRSPEYKKRMIRKMCSFNSPNKQEKRLNRLLDKIYPGEWKFVGNGEVVIDGKCPDFININGQKKIIELYGERWHKPTEEQTRIDFFKRYGYETLIIWVKQLANLQNASSIIKRFCEKTN